MSASKRASAVAALATTVALGFPAVAPAAGHRHHDRFGDVPSRVAAKFRAAERALARAQDRAEDGEDARAVTALSATGKHLATGTSAATRRIVADGRTGEVSARAAARTTDRVVDGSAVLLDGATDAVSDAGVTTLDAALTARDTVVAKVAALDAADREEYTDVLERIVDDAADEAADITEALSDDELTPAAEARLHDALGQLASTAQAAQSAIVSDEDDPAEDDVPGEDGTGSDATVDSGAARPSGSYGDDHGHARPDRGRGHRGGHGPRKDRKARTPDSDTGDEAQRPGQAGV